MLLTTPVSPIETHTEFFSLKGGDNFAALVIRKKVTGEVRRNK